MNKLLVCMGLSLAIGLSAQSSNAASASKDKKQAKKSLTAEGKASPNKPITHQLSSNASKGAQKIKMDQKWLSQHKAMNDYLKMAQTYLKKSTRTAASQTQAPIRTNQEHTASYKLGRAYANELLLKHFSDNSLSVEVKPLTSHELQQFGDSLNTHFDKADKAYFKLNNTSDTLSMVLADPDQVLAQLEKVSYKAGNSPTSRGTSQPPAAAFEITIKPQKSNNDFSTLTLTHMRQA